MEAFDGDSESTGSEDSRSKAVGKAVDGDEERDVGRGIGKLDFDLDIQYSDTIEIRASKLHTYKYR